MKKILSLIFFIALCVPLAACNQAENIDDNSENSSLPASSTAPATLTGTPTEPDQSIPDDYQFSVNSDNTITITKYKGEGGDVEIPAEIDGNKVTAIGNTFEETGAFQDCTTLTSVIIPDGVTEIQDNAFQGCTSLKTVTISASVTLLRNCAFDNCPNLQSIYFEGNAPQIAHDVLYPPLPTIYYHEGAVGWTNPWYSCPAETY
jgi:hypothetical protein